MKLVKDNEDDSYIDYVSDSDIDVPEGTTHLMLRMMRVKDGGRSLSMSFYSENEVVLDRSGDVDMPDGEVGVIDALCSGCDEIQPCKLVPVNEGAWWELACGSCRADTGIDIDATFATINIEED